MAFKKLAEFLVHAYMLVPAEGWTRLSTVKFVGSSNQSNPSNTPVVQAVYREKHEKQLLTIEMTGNLTKNAVSEQDVCAQDDNVQAIRACLHAVYLRWCFLETPSLF